MWFFNTFISSLIDKLDLTEGSMIPYVLALFAIVHKGNIAETNFRNETVCVCNCMFSSDPTGITVTRVK